MAAKAKVDEAVNNAKASIDQVTNNEGVDTAKSNGLDSINNIQPTVVKKDEAKQRLIKAEAKTEIDQTPNATDEEKAKAKVDEAVTTAKNAIDQATNNAGVNKWRRFNQQCATNGC